MVSIAAPHPLRRYQFYGHHVERVAYVLAIVLIIVTLLEALLGIVHNWWNGFLLLEVIVLALIFVAQRSRRPFFYIPFLIFQALFALVLVLYFINVIVGIVMAIGHGRNVFDGITDAISYYHHGREVRSGLDRLTGRTEDTILAPAPQLSNEALRESYATPGAQAQTYEGTYGTEYSTGMHIVSLLALLIGIIYLVLVLIHYFCVVRAFQFMRAENRLRNGGHVRQLVEQYETVVTTQKPMVGAGAA